MRCLSLLEYLSSLIISILSSLPFVSVECWLLACKQSTGDIKVHYSFIIDPTHTQIQHTTSNSIRCIVLPHRRTPSSCFPLSSMLQAFPLSPFPSSPKARGRLAHTEPLHISRSYILSPSLILRPQFLSPVSPDQGNCCYTTGFHQKS